MGEDVMVSDTNEYTDLLMGNRVEVYISVSSPAVDVTDFYTQGTQPI